MNESDEDLFRSSLDRWLAGRHSTQKALYLGSIDAKLQTPNSFDSGLVPWVEDDPHTLALVTAVLPVFVNEAAMRALQPLMSAITELETAGEVAFLLAVATMNRIERVTVTFVGKFRSTDVCELYNGSQLTVEAKPVVRGHRPSFRLTLEEKAIHRPPVTVTLDDGTQRVVRDQATSTIIVECEDQLASIERRQQSGLNLTGERVYRLDPYNLAHDPFRCASEVMTALTQDVQTQWREAEALALEPVSSKH